LNQHFTGIFFCQNSCAGFEFSSPYLCLENRIGLNVLVPISVDPVSGFNVIGIGGFVVIHHVDHGFAALARLSACSGDEHPLRADEFLPATKTDLVHNDRSFEEEFKEWIGAFWEHVIFYWRK